MSRQYPDCGHTRVKGDRYRRCVTCLGRTHAEAALSGADPVCAIKACVRQFRQGQSVSSLRCQRLLGMMASAAIALPLGMLRMRPFQIWYLSMKLNAVTDRHRRVM